MPRVGKIWRWTPAEIDTAVRLIAGASHRGTGFMRVQIGSVAAAITGDLRNCNGLREALVRERRIEPREAGSVGKKRQIVYRLVQPVPMKGEAQHEPA